MVTVQQRQHSQTDTSTSYNIIECLSIVGEWAGGQAGRVIPSHQPASMTGSAGNRFFGPNSGHALESSERGWRCDAQRK